MKEKQTFVCQQNEAGKYGCVNAQGEVIIPFEYDYMSCIGRYKTKLLKVQKDKKYGIIELDETVVLPIEYDEIEVCYKDDKATGLKVRKNGKDEVIEDLGSFYAIHSVFKEYGEVE